jgi:hypothetical protein
MHYKIVSFDSKNLTYTKKLTNRRTDNKKERVYFG